MTEHFETARTLLKEIRLSLDNSTHEMGQLDHSTPMMINKFERICRELPASILSSEDVEIVSANLAEQQFKISMLYANLRSLIQNVERVEENSFTSHVDPEGENAPLSREAIFQSFLECINDPGVTLRQLRDSFTRVSTEDVDEDNLDDFDQVLFSLITRLRST